MHVTFTPLQKTHFPLLLKWLYTPHLRIWWDPNTDWTNELIEKKYTPYTQGFKILGDIKKPMHAFIIMINETPIGYIQYYNKHDFPPEQGYSTEEFPKPLAAIDFYIGEKDYIGKGLGQKTLHNFLNEHVFKKYNACFVDPDTANKTAIHTYEKVGFKIIKEIAELTITWMIITNTPAKT